MATSSLLALIDDIATLLDDVAVLSKTAARKTAGVLGDDLALNAEQVSGVKAERELPVVWAVTKGSFINKLILVPAALLISAFMPALIVYLLLMGGLYLCFEGAEKLAHKWLHSAKERQQHHQQMLAAVADPQVDLVAFEKNKIKGAIRTDFILSAEIIVIILGSVQDSPFATQVTVLASLALAFTIGVYGLVAAIVKLDDLGLYLLRKSVSGSFNGLQRFAGRSLLTLAPMLMKFLSIVGTAAMFLVGGGIVVHSIPAVHHFIEPISKALATQAQWLASLGGIVMEGLVGLVAGALLVVLVTGMKKIRS